MTGSLALRVLGTRVEVRVSGAAADRAVAAAREAWGGLVLPAASAEVAAGASSAPAAGDPLGSSRAAAAPPPAHDACELPLATPLEFSVGRQEDIPRFLDSLSSRATLSGIEAQSGQLLMLHAAGLADPTSGRVVACVAPSGTGKTTLSTSAAGRLDYVTDETVAVASDLSIVRYPKPLSVKQPEPGAPKRQIEPGALGLRPAAQKDLALHRIVLLHRLRDGETASSREGSDAPRETEALPASPEAGEPDRLEPVDLLEAVVSLVPELSYLGRMRRPLHRIVEAVERTGGVWRLVYRESVDAVSLLAAALADRLPASGGEALALTRSDAELDAWDRTIADHQLARALEGGHDDGEEPRIRVTAPLDDIVIDPETSRALVFADRTVRLVSTPAAAALRAAATGTGITRDRIGAILRELFGSPPETVSGSDPIVALIDELHEHGLLAPVTNH